MLVFPPLTRDACLFCNLRQNRKAKCRHYRLLSTAHNINASLTATACSRCTSVSIVLSVLAVNRFPQDRIQLVTFCKDDIFCLLFWDLSIFFVLKTSYSSAHLLNVAKAESSAPPPPPPPPQPYSPVPDCSQSAAMCQQVLSSAH
jgi:hypothetical protein